VTEPCRVGVHACRIGDLPFWVGFGELWEIELDGRIEDDERKLVATRGRLVRRHRARRRLDTDCVDGGLHGLASRSWTKGPAGYDAERLRQAEWLAAALELK
jgi:hypothetical protein